MGSGLPGNPALKGQDQDTRAFQGRQPWRFQIIPDSALRTGSCVRKIIKRL
jgi:flagellar biosynthesis/type III secretory pathway protein FliH